MGFALPVGRPTSPPRCVAGGERSKFHYGAYTMSAVRWTLLFLVAVLIEVSVLPVLAGPAAPSIVVPVLLIGFVRQRFWPGLAFAGTSGLAFSVLAPASGGIQAMAGLVAFAAVHAFRALASWDEVPNRIGALAAGLLALPPAWILAASRADAWFGAHTPDLGWDDLVSGYVFREGIAAAVWFGAFAWLTLRSVAKGRARRLERL